MSQPVAAELLRPAAPEVTPQQGRHVSRREARPQKITGYLSAGEHLDLERARLKLRTRGISVDRRTVVQEAIAVRLNDLEARADGGLVASRLGDPAASGVPQPMAAGPP